MSLFSSTDVMAAAAPAAADKKAGTQSFGSETFTARERLDNIEKYIADLQPGQSCCYLTYGAWSSIELLEHLLNKSGPAAVYFSTWSISAEAIARAAAWHNTGVITDLHVLLDAGLRNRKPDLFQQALGSFPKLKITAIHAKVTVVQNELYNLVVIGSPNYTKNPRIETGVIIHNKDVADFNIKWMLEEFYGTE